MNTLIWIIIALVVTANVAVVAWTQACIWRRIDSLEDAFEAECDIYDEALGFTRKDQP